MTVITNWFMTAYGLKVTVNCWWGVTGRGLYCDGGGGTRPKTGADQGGETRAQLHDGQSAVKKGQYYISKHFSNNNNVFCPKSLEFFGLFTRLVRR